MFTDRELLFLRACSGEAKPDGSRPPRRRGAVSGSYRRAPRPQARPRTRERRGVARRGCTRLSNPATGPSDGAQARSPQRFSGRFPGRQTARFAAVGKSGRYLENVKIRWTRSGPGTVAIVSRSHQTPASADRRNSGTADTVPACPPAPVRLLLIGGITTFGHSINGHDCVNTYIESELCLSGSNEPVTACRGWGGNSAPNSTNQIETRTDVLSVGTGWGHGEPGRSARDGPALKKGRHDGRKDLCI